MNQLFQLRQNFDVDAELRGGFGFGPPDSPIEQ